MSPDPKSQSVETAGLSMKNRARVLCCCKAETGAKKIVSKKRIQLRMGVDLMLVFGLGPAPKPA